VIRHSVLVATLLITACGGKPKDDSSSQTQAADPRAASGSAVAAAPTSGAAGAAGSLGAPSARPAATITLAASDIAPVRRAPIDEAVAITGDLRPIERVDVRARLEGDLVGIFAREGQHVTQGQVLAQFEASQQESAHASAIADRTAAQSDLSTAQWNLDQTAELFKAGAVAERDLKAAQQTVAASQARLAAADARVRATASDLRDTRVIAPTSGVIENKIAENGEHLARGAPIFSLVRNDVLELAAAVPERQANGVRVGQVVHFTANARAFDGKVARVSPTVDPTTRSVTVYAQIPNPSGSLRGGTFASGRVVSRTVSNALVVPTSAIRQSPDETRPFVYKLAANVVDKASVDLGVVDEHTGLAEVVNGLSEGDRVIVGNVGALGRGMQVIIAGEERARPQRDDAGSGRQ
jgi:membrane fusion protein, multidrug efflux system